MKNKKLFAILTLVCFMFTLMPVAAFAAGPADTSYWYVDSSKTNTTTIGVLDGAMNVNTDAVAFIYDSRDNGTATDLGAGTLYVWATENGQPVSALTAETFGGMTPNATKAPLYAKGFKFATADFNTLGINVAFARSGDFAIHAAWSTAEVDSYTDLVQAVGSGETVVNVLGSAANPDKYEMTVSKGAGVTATVNNTPADEDYDATISNVVPNNVADQFTLSFEELTKNAAGTVTAREDVTHKTVTITTDSDNITVTPMATKTDYLGDLKIQLAASREGNYTIYVDVEGKVFVIGVECGNTSAAHIKTVEEPASPIALFTTGATFKSYEYIVFEITDINGNAVKDAKEDGGADGIYGENGKVKAKYLAFTEKPAATTLTNDKLGVEALGDGEYVLTINGTLDAEGTYSVKAILDNGSIATATWEVKKFETPVAIVIDKAPATVELGKVITPYLLYVDVNNVTKPATDAKLAATGYAIYSYEEGNKKVTLKTDEKYAGSVVKLTAVSERYDLVAVKEVKVAAEATEIAFVDDTLEVNVNNKVEWNVVDAEGNKVALSDIKDYKIRYVVLDKPADAKVSVYDATGDFDGEGVMALTSNKVGNVTVQVIAQVQVAQDYTTTTTAGVTTVTGAKAIQTKYYTGTEIFAVGTEDKGDVVVMSIGSNEIVKNDEVATMIAAPIIENNRTFVPFRALAEAFGAEVAWDEATQAVTASLNGVEVVMTIGSATYTINGEEAAMDVAPFINGSSTMVPVRFAAQAFGIKVIPTYDENGATADILFNL